MGDRPLSATDMGPFMRRHDHRMRYILGVLSGTFLLVSVGGFTWGMLERSSTGAFPGRLWFALLLPLLPIGLLWFANTVMRRKRRVQPDGSLPMNPDDARNAARVANAGAVYVAGIGLVTLANQVFSVLGAMHALPSLDAADGWLVARAFIVVTGALVAYFGNTWPRLPTPRGAECKPVVARRFNRLLGWALVIHGLLFVVAGLLLPAPVFFAAGVGTIGLSMMLFAVGLAVAQYRAARAPAAA